MQRLTFLSYLNIDVNHSSVIWFGVSALQCDNDDFQCNGSSDIIVMCYAAIVECDGIIQCAGGQDEVHCGMYMGVYLC